MDTRDYTEEKWLPVVGYEGLYEVSDQGRVKSLEKKVVYKDGRVRTQPERIRDPKFGSNWRPSLKMVHPDKPDRSLQIHRMVLEAFVGPCPEGMETLHYDDNPENNSLENLRWGTRSENQIDRVRNGRNHNASKTHCKRGHEFTPENTRIRTTGFRNCRTCYNKQRRDKRAKEKAQKTIRPLKRSLKRS